MSVSSSAAALQVYNNGELGDFLFGNESSLFSYQNQTITPFSKNIVPVIFLENVNFGQTLTVNLPYTGDLVGNIIFHVKLPRIEIPSGSTYASWTNAIGFSMINYVEILIGSRKVSHIEGELLEILDYFTTNSSKIKAEYTNVGRYDNINVLQNSNNNGNGPIELYVPLPFWFCKQLSAALPLIAIPNQVVQLKFNLNPFSQLVNYDGLSDPLTINPDDARLLVDYYYLSDEEKTDFITNDRQYNFEQYQTQSFSINANTINTNIQLSFVNAVKELIFVFREVSSEDNNDFFNYGLRSQNRLGEAFFSTVQLYFNGMARTEKLDEKYFRTVSTLASHTNPGNRNIYVIPFAVAPELNQSSGSVNISQLDNIALSFEFVNNLPACKLNVYAISYNVLDIQNRLASVIFL